MVGRIKTRLSSLGFRLQRAIRRIATAKPSIFVIASVIVASTVFFLGGGVYDLLAEPYIAVPISETRILFFYPYSVHEQAVLESLLVMTSYVMGFVGVLLIYQSTKYANKPRQAYILLLTGAVFLLFSYIWIENLLWSKLTVSL